MASGFAMPSSLAQVENVLRKRCTVAAFTPSRRSVIDSAILLTWTHPRFARGGSSRPPRTPFCARPLVKPLGLSQEVAAFLSQSWRQRTSVAVLHPACVCSPFNRPLALVEFARRRLISSTGYLARHPAQHTAFSLPPPPPSAPPHHTPGN